MQTTLPHLLPLLLLLLFLCHFKSTTSSPLPPLPAADCPDITAPVGTIRGFADASTSTCRYYNIPYAVPPIGPLRWQPPRLLSSLPSPSPYPATNRTLAQCVQTSITGSGLMAGTEDCLQLSLTLPVAPPPPSGYPVLVYFCGGGFQQCYPEDAGPWLHATQAFIFVSVPYRLGALGFFAVRELSDERSEGKVDGFSYSGNQGLQDQRTALHWLQANVAAFGGDPSHVTIEGESAGGFSVCYQLLLPNGTQVYSAAIAESGACDGPHPMGSVTLDEQEADHRQYFVAASPCAALKGSDLLPCLRNLSTDAVYALYNTASQHNPPYLPGLSIFAPVIDGVIVPDTPRALFQSGRAATVPLIVGTNSAETIMWIWNRGPNPTPPYAWNANDVAFQVRYDSGDNATLLEFYNATHYQQLYNISDEGRILIDATSASSFHCPARRLARWIAPHANVFHYDFNYLADSAPDTKWTGLAEHSVELQSIFYYPGSSHEDAVMAAQMQSYWHRFLVHRDVAHADPAIDRFYAPVYGNSSLVAWPRFRPARGGGDVSMHMQSGQQHLEVRERVHADQCELWDGTVPHPSITPRRLPPTPIRQRRLRRERE